VTEQVDVVIVGGGPVGLALAGELTLSGATPVVLERLAERNPVPKANGLVGQVVRWLDHRGLYQRCTGATAPPRPVPGYMFGGLALPLGGVPDNPLHILPLPQWELEGRLGEWVAELGVDVRRGHDVTGVAQEGDGVTVDHRGPGGPGRLRARYVVGCDGGHSEVRKQAGIDFVGVSSDRVVSYTAHVTLPTVSAAGLDVPGHGLLQPFTFHRTDHGVFVFASFQPGVHLVSAQEWDQPAPGDDEPVTLEDVRAAVTRVLGVEVPMTPPTQPGRYTMRRLAGRNTRIADRYRAGRLFVAGDAAHVHAATGGPGLNLGLLDAANLGWKLAATVRGHAPQHLLDTYHDERHPVGERVVLHTQAQSALLAPGPQVTALRTLVGELLTEPGNARRIAAMLAGADVRYGDNPRVGTWLADFPLTVEGHATRLAELARTGRPLLLDFTTDPTLADVARGWADRVDHVVATAATPSADAVLVRPDGHTAWISGAGTPEAALRDWFGDPVAGWGP
jgi:2-polyprenyl-6-methoxyphenol hydroxylase-like FAD-dependent oxidoreductase